jgi:dTMP kinase
MKTKKGKIIVIEGSDGVGKTTQTKLLIEKLKKENKKVKTIKFPQYKENYLGRYIRECLDGKHGDFSKIDPEIGSVLYALDRFESKEKIEKWIKEGNIVIADRYVSANQIHQGGKIENKKKRKEFLDWLSKIEYDLLGLPKPDLVIYLHAPFEVSKKLLKNRGEKLDIVESDNQYLKRSIASAENLSERNKNWFRINCTPNGNLLSKEEIHKKIWEKIKKMI